MASHTTSDRDVQQLFAGDGDMAQRMCALDWSSTPLGAVAGWPQSLRTCAQVLLRSRQPMFVWWGPALTHLYNDAHRATLGASHTDGLGQPAAIAAPVLWALLGTRAGSVLGHSDGAFEEAVTLVVDHNSRQEEGHYRFCFSPVPGDDGTADGLVCLIIDDTRRIIAERQQALLADLATRTQKVRTVAEACSLSMRSLATDASDIPFALLYVLGGDGQSLSLAATAGFIRGQPAADISAGWPLSAVAHGRDARLIQLEPSLAGILAGARSRPPTHALVLPAGAGVLVCGVSPYRRLDEGHQRFLHLVAAQVASALGRANARAGDEEAKARANRDARLRERVLDAVTHDLRSSLSAITTTAELIDRRLRRGNHDLAPSRHAGIIRRSVARMDRLLGDFVDAETIAAGTLELDLEPCAVDSLLRPLDLVFAERAGDRPVAFTVHAARQLSVRADRKRLVQALTNLVDNAVRFSDDGGQVTVRAVAEGGRVVMSVADTGVGIAPEVLAHLFDRHWRAEHEDHGARHFGLFIARGIIEAHGGDLVVTSKVGQGSTFSFSLPAK